MTVSGWSQKAKDNRWFLLGVAFLALNAGAVFLLCRDHAFTCKVSVELAAPGDGQLRGKDSVRWRFSEDMVSGSETDRWLSAPPVRFLPSVEGGARWVTPRDLEFVPANEWPKCTAFHAVFNEPLVSLDSMLVRAKKVFRLATEALALTGVSQGGVTEHGEMLVTLDFNADVWPQDLEGQASFADGAGNELNWTILDRCRSKRFTVCVNKAATNGLVLNLKAGLKSAEGPMGLVEKISWPIPPPAADLSVTSVNPEMRSLEPGSIQVQFSAPVKPETLAAYIKVEPAVTVTVEPCQRYYRDVGCRYVINGDFKAGRSYGLRILKGVPGVKGSLQQEYSTRVYFDDAQPNIEMATEGNFMMAGGQMIIPFKTVNISKCIVTVRQVYANNLVFLALENYRSYRAGSADMSRKICEKEIVLKQSPNEVLETSVSVRDLIGTRQGVFDIEIVESGKGYPRAGHHVVVSDTGLTVKRSSDDMLVWVNSLKTLEPLAGAEVTVHSSANQALCSGQTDADGFAHLTLDPRGLDGQPMVVTARRGDDLTYLRVDEAAVPIKGGVAWRNYLTEGYEACLFTDRGIYRPGETTHLKAIVRGKDLECPPPFPVKMTVYRPDGKVEKETTGLLTDVGTAEFEVKWPDYVPTGRYRLALSDPANTKMRYSDTVVAVEEFVPPQIKAEVKTAAARCKAGGTFEFDVSADYLFGRPAAGLPVEALVDFKPIPFAPPQMKDFVFGDPQKTFSTIRKSVGKAELGPDGKMTFKVQTGADWRPPAAVKALVIGTVRDIGGRTVTAYAGRMVDAYPFYIGLRAGGHDARVGQEQAFTIVAVAPDGSVCSHAPALRVTLDKLFWTSVLRLERGNRYSHGYSEKEASRVLTRIVALEQGRGTFAFTPGDCAEYRVTVEDPASGTSTSMELYAGDGEQSWTSRSMEAPDAVELTLDKAHYVPGDTAVLRIKAPFVGKALLTLESSRVLSRRIIVMTNNTAEVKLPVEAGYQPNVYCCVSVIRPVKPEKVWGPHRAAGMIPLAVELPERKAEIELTVPKEVRPGSRLDVDLRVVGQNGGGVEAEVVLAAVDEGICMLTDFRNPNPYAWFFEPRCPGVIQYDLYSRLMPELEKTLGGEASSPGGGGDEDLGRRLNPIKARRFKPVALWASSVRSDKDGRAKITFDVPEFTGQLRLMAVAVDKTRFGSAASRVLVKRPMVVQSSLPRFLAPNDRFRMPVRVFNESGSNGEATVTLWMAGSLAQAGAETSLVRRISVAAGKEANVAFDLRALAVPGLATCRLDVVMGAERYSEEVEMAVRPAAGRVSLAEGGMIPAGKSQVVKASAAWLEGTGRTDVWLSGLPNIQMGGGLAYLLHYPYGCLEQTTSKSFPLLYLYDLAEQMYPGWLKRSETDALVKAGIQRILTMQTHDGGFGLWCGCDTYPWGSAYATHFLLEASRAGYPVPRERLDLAVDYLEKWIGRGRKAASAAMTAYERSEEQYPNYDLSYVALVLSLAGRAPQGWIARLREQEEKLDRGTRANIGAALLAAGLRRDGREVLEKIGAWPTVVPYRQTSGPLGSDVRDDAITLSALLDSDPAGAAIPGLVRRLEASRKNGRWYNTQENALALMAMGKYCNVLAKKKEPISGTVAWGDRTMTFGNTNLFHAEAHARKQDTLTLRNDGKSNLYYFLKTEGVPTGGRVAEADSRIKVRREFLTMDGQPADVKALTQGELYVVRVTLEESAGAVENIVIEELLPAGLEIENPNLNTSQQVKWPNTQPALPLLHTDVRDDRIILFAGPMSQKGYGHYAVRAVTPGEFVLPAIAAECMYDPDIRSVNGAGVVRVVEAK